MPFFIILIIGITCILFIRMESKFEEEEEYRFKRSSYSLISGTVQNCKEWLLSQALILARDKAVKESYIYDRPERIKNEFSDFWGLLHKDFGVEELHFFKYPDENFFSFSSLSAEPKILKNRKDVVFLQTAVIPSSYFFVCKRYPGLRASYPILVDQKVLGATSFGISIEKLANVLQSSVSEKVFYLLNKQVMKKNLDPEFFESWKKKSMKEDNLFYYYHLNETLPYQYLDEKTYKNGKNLFFIYPLEDYKGNIIGYIGVKRNYSFFFNYIYYITGLFLVTAIMVIVVVIVLSFSQTKYLKNQRDTILQLLTLVECRRFGEVENFYKTYIPTKDIFDSIIGKIATINKRLKSHIDEMYGKLKTTSKKAFIDELTGVFNRYALRNFHKILDGLNYSVLMVDIDHFKSVNDTFGHEVGDKVLKFLVNKIMDSIRIKDKVFRYGGEEFVILLPETSQDAAAKLAERIRKDVENSEINIGNFKKIKITASIGIAERRDGESIEEVIKRADEAMYRAKKAGRNRVSD